VRLQVLDESGAHVGHAGSSGGAHLQAVVVAAAFEGKTLVQRHRLVYAALGDAMKSEVHALALTARTPAEDEAAR
jgi:BolA family transcriptional regulator, general stress-responsive regulator